MSTNWSQGGQPLSAIQNNGSNYPSGPPMQSNGPPPICFNCGNEGHFLVACPDPIRSTSAGLPTARAPDGTPPHSNGNAEGSGAQRPQWANGQKGAVVTRYPVPKNAPVVTRYAIPTKPPQYGNNGGSYGPPNTPYQQYPGAAPQLQAYPPHGPPAQASYSSYPPNQQYGPPGPQYPYNQQQQPYNGPPPTPQYGSQGYQAPPYNQYSPSNGPQQYGGPAYQNSPQQYGPLPAGPPYQPPGNPYPPQNGSYGANYRRPSGPYQAPPPQWNNTPPVPTPHSAPPYQRQHSNHSQYDAGYQREYSRTPSHQSNPQQAQDYGHGSEGYQQTPQTPASNYSNQQRPAQASQSSPVNAPYESRSSSRASTPYARRGSNSSSTRKGQKAESTTPSGKENQEPAESQDGKEQPDNEEQEFNWEFKKIFMEPEKQEWVALAQPLSTTFDMTPVPLLDMRSTNSVSRYARKENLKEFTRSIRSAPQWSYLKEDPAFSDSELDGPLIPFHEIPAWTAARHGTEEFTENRRPSRKRAWSDEKDDVDNQIKLESARLDTSEQQAEDQEGQPKVKRQKNKETQEQQMFADTSPERPGTPTATAGTPVLGRAGTPSFGADDDVWAPQPGEGAESAPVDPTEALLASLGVSGAPKPVQEEPLPPAVASAVEDHFQAPPDPTLVPTLSRHASFENTPYPPNSHPNPQYRNGHPVNPPYANIHRGNPHYTNGPPAPNPSYPNGPHAIPQYNNQSPVHPPYYNAHHGNTQYGPPGNMPYPHGPPLQRQYSSVPANPQYGNNGESQYINGPPLNPQFNLGPHGTPPLRQDSGYVSARGSYSNDSGQHDFDRRRNSQMECQQQPLSHVTRIDTGDGTTTSKENTLQKADQKQDSDAEKSESPLSLIERELLYPKLTAPPSKSKKAEPQRQVDDLVRKKRQPIVAEAYSRRW